MSAVRENSLNETPLVSVIVPTYGREQLVRRCLQSLLRQDYPHLEVVVIDQDPARRLPELFPDEIGDERTTYLNFPQAGAAIARNRGVETARGQLLLFIDDDAYAKPGWAEGYVRLFRDFPQAGLASGVILGEWEAPPPDWFPMEYAYLFGHYELDQDAGLLPEGQIPIACNMGGRAEAVRQAGGFDERFGYNRFRERPHLAGEETMLGLQIQRGGWGLYYCPDSVVGHHIPAGKTDRWPFLRRNFWEGVTVSEMNLALGQAGRFRDVARWHLKEMAMAAARCLLPNYEARYSMTAPQIRMMSLRRVFFSAGVIYGAMHSRLDMDYDPKSVLRQVAPSGQRSSQADY